MKFEKYKQSIERYFGLTHHIRWALLAAITIIVSLILYPTMIITDHGYTIGDVVDRDIKAPTDFLFEDTATTALNREQAVESVLTVYDHDTEISKRMQQSINQAFADMRKLYETTSAPAAAVPDKKEADAGGGDTDEAAAPPDKETQARLLHERIFQQKPAFEKAMNLEFSDGAFRLLEKEGFSKEISDLIIQILTAILDNGVVANKEILLREADKGIRLREIGKDSEKTVTNVKQFYGLDQSKVMVRIVGQPLLEGVPYNIVNMIVDVVQDLIQPNITLNKNETEKRKKEAAANIKPVFHKIKAGEMLVREGEIISETQLKKLKALEAQSRKRDEWMRRIGSLIMILSIFSMMPILYRRNLAQMGSGLNKNLLFLSCVFIVFLFIAKLTASFSEAIVAGPSLSLSAGTVFYGIPIAAGAMIICLFLGLDIAIPFATVTAVCTAVIFQGRFEMLFYFLLSGAMGAYWVQRCRERKVFIKAGLKLGLLNIVLALATEIYSGEWAGMLLVWDSIFAFAGGIGAGIATAGLAPLLEIAFGYSTDITLLEQANLDRPLLRRLMIESPGTYHHSMVVGSMVEAAASEIGANPLLAKVCGYYHDIGKLKKPLYFIENQSDGINRHDKLAPSMSALILIAHIKHGVQLARENKLGQEIIDTIQQHHGTSLIRYFFEKAKQIRGEHAVKIEDFRYPGPRPQTREAGLVMLADVVEAASRTLENPTPARIQKLVQDLINKVFSDGQLDNCELTLKDLHSIAKSFHKILSGIHHHRIEYAEAGARSGRQMKNGHSDKQSAKRISAVSAETRADGTNHLRRLGLS